MIARVKKWLATVKLDLTLRRRRKLRMIEQARSRKAYWQSVRKHHAHDPLWRAA